MAEPTVKINLANPTEVARETLRRLALRRIAPTPDNYQTLYEEIAGAPGMAATTAIAATAASALSGLVMDLSLHHPELAGPVEILDRAIRKGDWAQCRKQLSQIALQLKQRTDGSGSEEDLALLRDLLAKTLEFGLIPQLSHHPTLADRAQQLAAAVREASSASALRNAAASLKSLWIDIDQHASHLHDRQETFRRILLLVENIGELLDDDTWLRGQLDMVQEIVAGPLRLQSLQEAEKRLKEVIFKQSLVKHGLREATATLKATMTTFVSRMRDAVAANDEYQGKIASHIERIGSTEDVRELNRILESLLEETRTAQSDTRRAHSQLIQERDAALQAESRIRQLETQLAEMSALVREDPLTRSLNRRGLDDEFAREASRADRYASPFCIAVLDVDNFKALNDKRGHQTGDEALIHLVKIAKEELRLTDHIARMGGEEFLILLPNTPLDEAMSIVTRLQRSLTKKYFLDNNERVLITFSAGVAARAPGESQEAAIARADAAMYEAKRAGKNRVSRAADVPGEAG
ncbi:GGDEF domain-containing protein [Thiobacillus sp. 65-1402]|uniref:GGDEF domain-containing protein n=1 Tax=Thiobacillus sp. 65-1402 TaxID=1895861 RepID=UPI00096322C5|nr:GGDEF domain-containing protein [Thiobacillus sp. 65-1402]OJW74868.1 MAG: GGDEF domain-containing protein [Thiobacillus sp. 65-1402]